MYVPIEKKASSHSTYLTKVLKSHPKKKLIAVEKGCVQAKQIG